MKSTVVIPNYNGIRFIEKCMKALQEDVSAEFDICIVDNGSTDGSREWIEQNCPQVKLIALRENTGFCRAVNTGIRAAETPYVILLNNDTAVEPGFVKELEEALERHRNAFSVSAKMVDMYHPEILDGTGDLYCALGWAFARGKGKAAAAHYTRETEIFSACAGAAIYKKELIKRLGYFDERHFAYLEDCDLGYRAQRYGYRNYYTPRAVVYHAGSGVSGSRHNEFKVRLSSRNSIFLIRKNMPLLQILLNLPFLLAGFGIKYVFFARKGLGRTYREGCLEGLRFPLYPSKGEGSRKRGGGRIGMYFRIQIMLWINMFRRLAG